MLFDLLLRRGEQRAHFARREHHRHAVLHRPLDLQLARRRLGDDPLLFEVPEEDLERRDFATDRRVAVRSGAELIEVLLEMLRRDVHHLGVAHVKVKLAEIGLICADGAIRQIPLDLPVLQEVGNRLLHIHCGHSLHSLWGDFTKSYVPARRSQELFVRSLCCESMPE